MIRSSLVAGALLSLVACNGRGSERAAGPPAPVHPPDGSGTAPAAGSSGTPMPSSTSTVAIGAHVTASKPGRPPLQRLTVDVTIDNPGDAARWITIAKQIPLDPDAVGGVDSLEVRGQGAALLGTFRGIAGVHALRVAGHAKVTVANLEVGWWRGSPTDALPGLAVTVADELTIGGAPAKAWFGVEPLVGDGVTIDAAGAATDAHATDGAEAPLALTGAAPTTAALTLP